MKKIWRVVMVLTMVVCAGPLRAAEDGANWQYTGTVVDEAGRAVAGANVEVYGTTTGRLDATETRTNRAAFPPFVLKRADQSLAGQVLGPDDKPLAGAMVQLNDEWHRDLPGALSDRQGRFFFNGVCAGEVRLTAYASGPPGPGLGRQMTADFVNARVGETNVVVRMR
jgi:protocatechuate 3,4-dioxygenase beta subunit